jgi:hypothetical protein
VTDDRQRYRHFFRCRACGDRFSVVRMTASGDGLNPRCPKRACGGKAKQSFTADVGFDPAEGKAPGVVGANVLVRAYDMALEMTAQDQGLTNIQDHSRPGSVVRMGEPTAPPLPAHLQQQASNFWSGPQKQKARTGKVDMSPIFGSRAGSVPQPQAVIPPMGKQADTSLIEPILRARPTGTSPVPVGRVVADTNVGGKHVLQ